VREAVLERVDGAAEVVGEPWHLEPHLTGARARSGKPASRIASIVICSWQPDVTGVSI
jgi:hypothetical protein